MFYENRNNINNALFPPQQQHPQLLPNPDEIQIPPPIPNQPIQQQQQDLPVAIWRPPNQYHANIFTPHYNPGTGTSHIRYDPNELQIVPEDFDFDEPPQLFGENAPPNYGNRLRGNRVGELVPKEDMGYTMKHKSLVNRAYNKHFRTAQNINDLKCQLYPKSCDWSWSDYLYAPYNWWFRKGYYSRGKKLTKKQKEKMRNKIMKNIIKDLHQKSRIPRRHRGNSRLLKRNRKLHKGGVNYVTVGSDLTTAAQQLQNYNPNAIKDDASLLYLHQNDLRNPENSPIKLPVKFAPVDWTYDWNLTKIYPTLTEDQKKAVKYQIYNNYIQRLPALNYKYYVSTPKRILGSIPGFKQLNYVDIPTNNPRQAIVNFQGNPTWKEDFEAYDNGIVRVTDPFIELNPNFRNLRTDEIEYIMKNNNLIPDDYKPDRLSAINFAYNNKIGLQQQLLRIEMDAAFLDAMDAFDKGNIDEYNRLLKLNALLGTREMNDEDINKRSKLYTYLLENPEKLEKFKNLENPFYGPENNPELNKLANEDKFRVRNVERVANSDTNINSEINYALSGHEVPDEWKNATSGEKFDLAMNTFKKAFSDWKELEGSQFQKAIDSVKEADVTGFASNLILCFDNVFRLFPMTYYKFKEYLHGGVTQV